MSLRIFWIKSEGEALESSFFIFQLQTPTFNLQTMEMKINFDQLFGDGSELNSTHQAPSFDFDHSLEASLNHSFEYKLTFGQDFFESHESQDQQHIKYSNSKQLLDEIKSTHTNNSIKTKQSYHSNNPPKPGQRLYYQSQASELRKNKQRERIQSQKQAQIRSLPFAPSINKNSRKIAQKVRKEPRQEIPRKKEIVKPTVLIKEQQLLKECTFQPKLISKNTKSHTKSKQQLFYYLHNTSKLKQIKMQKREDEQLLDSKLKKVPKEHFDQFLKRNQQYSSHIKQKHQTLKQNIQQYDLKTGQKLFSPKISDNKLANFHKNSSSKMLHQPNLKNQTDKNAFEKVSVDCKPKSGIFKKKQLINQRNQELSPLVHQSQNVGAVLNQSQQIDQNEQYRRYTEEYDRRMALRQASLSHHQIIPEESQLSIHDMSKQDADYGNRSQGFLQQRRQNNNQYQEEEGEQNDDFNPDGVGEEENLWASHQIKPFQLSNVNQYLAASEEDEHQHKNNYVMDILNNLMSNKPQEE